MSVANQKIVVIAPRKDYIKNFSRIHNDALQLAMQQLKGEHLKLWLYLVKNKDNYTLELSQKALEEWGLKKDSYYRAIESLIELGYLTQTKDDSNIYTFTEYSQNAKEISQNEKELSQIANTSSQNPQRNTINTIQTINKSGDNRQVDYTATHEEEKGTINNPIEIDKEWLINRSNSIIKCKGDIYKYGNRYYKL